MSIDKITINGIVFTAENISEVKKLPGVGEEVFAFLSRWWNSSGVVEFETSGSTGVPKLMEIAKSAMLRSARITNTYFGFSTGGTSLVCMPVKFIAGAMMLVRAMEGNYGVYIVKPSSNPFNNVSGKSFLYTACTPMQAAEAIGNSVTLKIFMAIPVVLIGGGEIVPDTEQKLSQLSNKLVATYGMTETITHIAVRDISGINRSDYFTVLPEFDVKPDDRGCLVIEAAHLPQPVITNDMVEIKGNSFKWIGRWDNVINSGGLKFNPEEMEKSIQHLVPQRFVISSVPHKSLGNKLVLVLELDSIDPEHETKLLKQVSLVLTGPKKVHEVRILGEFPVTETGKINRKQILSKLVKK